MTKEDVKKMEQAWVWYVLNGWTDFETERWLNNASMTIMELASEHGRGIKTAPDGLYQ